MVPGRTAFHHVGSQGEGRARKADERGLAELCHREADGFADGLQRFPGQLGQRGYVVGSPYRLVQHRPDTGNDVHSDAGELEGNDDVGEEDTGVYIMATHRLQRDLCGEFRTQA